MLDPDQGQQNLGSEHRLGSENGPTLKRILEIDSGNQRIQSN